MFSNYENVQIPREFETSKLNLEIFDESFVLSENPQALISSQTEHQNAPSKHAELSDFEISPDLEIDLSDVVQFPMEQGESCRDRSNTTVSYCSISTDGSSDPSVCDINDQIHTIHQSPVHDRLCADIPDSQLLDTCVFALGDIASEPLCMTSANSSPTPSSTSFISEPSPCYLDFSLNASLAPTTASPAHPHPSPTALVVAAQRASPIPYGPTSICPSPPHSIDGDVRLFCPPLPPTPAAIPQSPSASLQVAVRCAKDAVEDVWYADRHFPAFNVQLVDATTGDGLKHTPLGWQVVVDVVDGNGADANSKVSTRTEDRVFGVHDGEATISGIRFCAVSSKCGGHFRFVISVRTPNSGVAIASRPFVTPPFQVLSYRLYHAPKVACDQLRPDDSVSKIKGIGSLYAKRLQSIGIGKVSQLAAIDLHALGEVGCQRLLDSLRKHRGALTLAKLDAHIRSARAIVEKHSQCAVTDSTSVSAFGTGASAPAQDSPVHTHARRKEHTRDWVADSPPPKKQRCQQWPTCTMLSNVIAAV